MKKKPDVPEVKSSQWFSTEIYFGRTISTGEEVSEKQFADFLSKKVTPAFPAGLTVFEAYGQMRRSNGEIVKQKTKVVVLVHMNTKADDEAIRKLISAYRAKFANPQVMFLTKQVTPWFYGD